MEELRGRDLGMRAQAAQLLEKAGAKARPVAPALLTLTADRDRMTRIYACQVLAKLGGAEAETAGTVLRELLIEDDATVRTQAAAVLWDQGAVRESLPVLVAALGSNDQIAVNTANQVLQRIGTTAAGEGAGAGPGATRWPTAAPPAATRSSTSCSGWARPPGRPRRRWLAS